MAFRLTDLFGLSAIGIDGIIDPDQTVADRFLDLRHAILHLTPIGRRPREARLVSRDFEGLADAVDGIASEVERVRNMRLIVHAGYFGRCGICEKRKIWWYCSVRLQHHRKKFVQ